MSLAAALWLIPIAFFAGALLLIVLRPGVAQRSARVAHNHKVAGSSPAPRTISRLAA